LGTSEKRWMPGPVSANQFNSYKADLRAVVEGKLDSNLPKTTKEQISNSVQNNVVFLGRKSASMNCREYDVSEKFPFGCKILKDVVSSNLDKVIGVPLHPTAPADIRKSAPILND